MTKRLGYLVLALAVGSGAALAQTKAPVAPTPPARIPAGGERLAVLQRLPEQIVGFTRAAPPEQDTTANVEDGAYLRYRGTPGFMTVFLYRIRGREVPNGAESPIVQSELAGSERSMLTAMAQPAPDGTRPTRAELITGYAFGAPDGQRFRCVEARRAIAPPQGGGGAWHQHEHVCVTGLMRGYLKMRVTYRAPGAEADRVRDAVQQMVGAAGAALR